MKPTNVRTITCIVAGIFAFAITSIMIPTIGVFVVAIQRGLFDVIPWENINYPGLGVYSSLIILTILSTLFLLFVLLSLFSRIEITQEGVVYQNLISKGTIRFEEIAIVTSPKWSKKLRLVVIQRQGTTFFRPQGLLFQLFHGIWAGVYKPVIILWENALETENQIKQMKR